MLGRGMLDRRRAFDAIAFRAISLVNVVSVNCCVRRHERRVLRRRVWRASGAQHDGRARGARHPAAATAAASARAAAHLVGTYH